jgi:hypothetical protein
VRKLGRQAGQLGTGLLAREGLQPLGNRIAQCLQPVAWRVVSASTLMSAEQMDRMVRSVEFVQVADWLNAYVVSQHWLFAFRIIQKTNRCPNRRFVSGSFA